MAELLKPEVITCKQVSNAQTLHSTLWLENFYKKTTSKRINIYSPLYRSVHDFLLIWNIFEREVLNNNSEGFKIFRQEDILNFADSHVQNHAQIDSFFAFLRKRYVESKNGSLLFNHLEIKEGKEKDFIWNSLNDKMPSFQEKNHICLVITWRYRNNLFHGNKVPAEIIEQVKLFEKANDYLISYIEWNDTQKQ